MLPSHLLQKTEWVFLGPMGPELPPSFKELPLLGVDGGANYASSLDIWVGDADSFKGKITASHIFRHPEDKDSSDLALGLSLFQEQRHYKFHFWGFLGGRRDHEIFNLGEAMAFLDQHQECQISFYNNEGKVLYYIVGAGLWKFSHQGLFSLGTIKKQSVRLTGACKYPIEKPAIIPPLASFGLSNQGHGEMELETDGPVFVHFPEIS